MPVIACRQDRIVRMYTMAVRPLLAPVCAIATKVWKTNDRQCLAHADAGCVQWTQGVCSARQALFKMGKLSSMALPVCSNFQDATKVDV